MAVDDKSCAVETVLREKATSDPGSVGATMSGVVIEVKVKEGHGIKKGDPVCGKVSLILPSYRIDQYTSRVISHERNEGESLPYLDLCVLTVIFRWNPL